MVQSYALLLSEKVTPMKNLHLGKKIIICLLNFSMGMRLKIAIMIGTDHKYSVRNIWLRNVHQFDSICSMFVMYKHYIESSIP